MARFDRKKMKQDEFVDSTMKVFVYLEEHPKPFLYGAAGLVVLVALGWVVMGFAKGAGGHAADLLARGEAALSAQVTPGAAHPDDPYHPVFSSNEERARAAAQRLEEASHSGRISGRVAGYLHGVALLEAGDRPGAVSALEDAVKRLGDDETLGGPVKAALAEAYESAGKPDQAVEIWRGLAGAGAGYPRDLALFGMGRAQERAGKSGEAKATFKEVVDLYPNSPVLAVAKGRLAKLGA